MLKNGKLLLMILIIICVLSLGFAKFKEEVSARADARSAIAAVKQHLLMAEAVMDYKKQQGLYPDEKIYKILNGSHKTETDEAKAREAFISVYNEMDIFKDPKFTLTKNTGFSDGNWIYFTHTGLGRGADVTGLVSKAMPGADYQNGKGPRSDLDFLLEYKEGTPRTVTINCLPLTSYQVKVCEKVLEYFRKNPQAGINFIIPQTKVAVNDITFE